MAPAPTWPSVFYAGHGIQVGETNYMLPVGAVLVEEQDLEFVAIEVGLPLRLMDRSGARVKLVVLDACRNNPLAQTLASSLEASGRSAAVGRGLSRIGGAQGTLMVFATAPDAIAEDGAGRNSPFTRALLDNIETPGLEVSLLFRRVRADVMAATNGKQVPWVNEALLGEFYFAPAEETADDAPASSADATAPMVEQETLFWVSIKDGANPANFEAYLTQFPDGTFAGLARNRLEALSGTGREAEEEQIASLPPEPDPAAVEDDIGLTRDDRRTIQRALNTVGHAAGVEDGLFGRRSRRALREWQVASGADGTGFLTPAQAEALLAIGHAAPAPEPYRAEEAQAAFVRPPENAIPRAYWPTDMEVDPGVRKIVETHPAFQGAPSLGVRAVRARRSDDDSTNIQETRYWQIAPGLIYAETGSKSQSAWDGVPGAHVGSSNSRSIFSTFLVSSGSLASVSRGEFSRPGNSGRTDWIETLTGIGSISGELFPLRVGNSASFSLSKRRTNRVDDQTIYFNNRYELRVLSRGPAAERDPRIPGDYYLIQARERVSYTHWDGGALSYNCTWEATFFEALGVNLDVGSYTSECSDGDAPVTDDYELLDIELVE